MLPLFRSVPPFLASLFSLFTGIIGLFVPWCRIPLVIDKLDYQISLPVDIGLLNVFNLPVFDSNVTPFKTAARVTMTFLTLSMLVCFFSVSASLICLGKNNNLFFNGQNLILIFSIICNVAAVVSYVSLTFRYVDSGFYVDGVWLNFITVILGLISVLSSLSADVEIKRIRHMQPRLSVTYMSIDQG
jgi:hypothetical protein